MQRFTRLLRGSWLRWRREAPSLLTPSLPKTSSNTIRHYAHQPPPPDGHAEQTRTSASSPQHVQRRKAKSSLKRKTIFAEAFADESTPHTLFHNAATSTALAGAQESSTSNKEQRNSEGSRDSRSSPTSSSNPAGHTRRQTSRKVSSAALLKSLEAQHSPFAATLRKTLTPRHTGPHGAVADPHTAHQTDEQRRTAAALRADEDRDSRRHGHDPALVVQADTRRRQVRLNQVQRELIWTARQQQYHNLLHRVVACLQSHRSPVEKCQTLFALHDEAITQHLRLRADTYEDIFHTLYSVGVRRGGGAGQPGKTSLSPSAQLTTGDAQWEGDWSGHDAAHSSGGSLPAELASPAAASSTVLSSHGLTHVWEMYRYAVDSGTDPTARMLQYVMGLLEHASVALAVSRATPAATSTNMPLGENGESSEAHGSRNIDGPSRRARSSGLLLVEAKAHSLLMDADRFHLTPSEYTINSYIAICEACDVMHLAVARVTDYQTRHERQPSAGMYARLLTGLVRCGRYDDAMAVVTTMQNVPMTAYLLNAVLQTARHSRDPASAFTFYRALFFAPSSPLRVDGDANRNETARRAEPPTRSSTRLVPSLITFSILVEVMQVTGSCAELNFVLAEMQHYRIKGNGMLLNKLLRLMDESGTSRKQREALQRAMESKQIRVFDENKRPTSLPIAP